MYIKKYINKSALNKLKTGANAVEFYVHHRIFFVDFMDILLSRKIYVLFIFPR